MKKTTGRIVVYIVASLMAMALGAPTWAAFLGGLIYSMQIFPEAP